MSAGSIAPLRFLTNCASNAYHGVLNDRPLWRVPLSVAWGMWPIFAWLVGFKKAAYIPIDWRPTIHTEWLPAANDLLVSLTGVFFCTLLAAPFAWKLWISAADKAESAPDARCDAFWWAEKQKLAALVLIAYPATLSLLDFLADTQITVAKDILAFVTYGALHFASPFLGGSQEGRPDALSQDPELTSFLLMLFCAFSQPSFCTSLQLRMWAQRSRGRWDPPIWLR